ENQFCVLGSCFLHRLSSKCLALFEVSQRPPSLRGSQVDARIVAHWRRQAAERFHGRQCFFPLSSPRLRSRQTQAVFEVVGETSKKRTVALGGIVPLLRSFAVSGFDQQTVLARKRCRQIVSRLRRQTCLLVVSEQSPGRGQCGVSQGVGRVCRHSFLEKVASCDGVEDTQLG